MAQKSMHGFLMQRFLNARDPLYNTRHRTAHTTWLRAASPRAVPRRVRPGARRYVPAWPGRPARSRMTREHSTHHRHTAPQALKHTRTHVSLYPRPPDAPSWPDRRTYRRDRTTLGDLCVVGDSGLQSVNVSFQASKAVRVLFWPFYRYWSMCMYMLHAHAHVHVHVAHGERYQ